MLPMLKADKASFAYVDNRLFPPRCNKCKYYVEGGKCVLVKGLIDGKNGSCNLWVKGNPRKYPLGMAPLTQKESGYVEVAGGPRCGVCVFYEDPRQCQLVKGDIDPSYGCCNAWKENEKRL